MCNENLSVGSIQSCGLHPSCDCSYLCQGAVADLYPNSFAKKNVKNSKFYLFSQTEINCSSLVAIHRPWVVTLLVTSCESSVPTQGGETEAQSNKLLAAAKATDREHPPGFSAPVATPRLSSGVLPTS